jgi:cathepsin L
MRTILLVLVLAISLAAARRPKWNELEGYNFKRYVSDFKKVYASTEEEQMREKVFNANLDKILIHNAQKHSWRKGVNHLTDRTTAELKAMNGGKSRSMKKQADELRSKPYVSTYKATTYPLPREVDYRKSIPSVLTAVKDQGMCGSCWAHGSTENMETFWALATGDLYVLSQQQVTACAPNPNQCGGTGGCGGSIAELAFDYVVNAGGIAQEWTYPYTAYSGTTGNCSASITPVVQLSGYTKVKANDQFAVMDALAHAGPLSVNVDASDWSSYESGIFSGCNFANNISIDHVVQLVGYGHDGDLGLDYWIVRNSWSPAYGESGFIRVHRSASPSCGWDVDPQDGTGCKGGPNQLWTCGMCGILFDTSFPNVKTN